MTALGIIGLTVLIAPYAIGLGTWAVYIIVYLARQGFGGRRHRGRLIRDLAAVDHHHSNLTLDWQRYRYLELDDLIVLAARYDLQFTRQVVYQDRWELQFDRAQPANEPRQDRPPAAVHDHSHTEPCTCTSTDYRRIWITESRSLRPAERGLKKPNPTWPPHSARAHVID